MFTVFIRSGEGEALDEVFIRDGKATVGSGKDNTIILEGRKVAKSHALLDVREDGVYITNQARMKSILVGGNKTEQHGPLTVNDDIQIGDYRLRVRITAIDPDQPEEAESGSRQSRQRSLYQVWQRQLHKLVEIQLKSHSIGLKSEKANTLIKNVVSEAANEMKGVPPELDKTKLAMRVYGEITGYGPLDSLLANKDISEIMVNTYEEIFYQEDGENKLFAGYFTDDEALLDTMTRMVASSGRHIDQKSPLVDATLRDGTRINAVIPPLATRGPSLTIRKVSLEQLSGTHLINKDTLNSDQLNFLKVAVANRKNILISGGTGTGKSTLLNVLSSYIPESERIVTVEDAAELTLDQSNRVALESRPPDAYGEGEIKIRDLVKNALRMSPDRIVVGECRGGEALDMLQAMNTGHSGSLTTIHANSPRDCIARLEVLVLMSGVELPLSAIRHQIASSIDIIVQLTRFPCGSRKVTSITEVCGMEGGTVQIGELFKYEQSGYDDKGRVMGKFVSTGIVPGFYESLRERGVFVDMTIFQNE